MRKDEWNLKKYRVWCQANLGIIRSFLIYGCITGGNKYGRNAISQCKPLTYIRYKTRATE